MHLFNRQIQFVGAPAEVRAYAAEMRAYVSDKTGREVGLWATLFGQPAGTMGYTTAFDGVADYLATTATLLDDEEYNAKIAAHQHLLAGPAVDMLMEPMHGEIGTERPPVGACAVVNSATITAGMYEQAFAWSIDIAQHNESVSGTPVMFLTSSFGAFGQVGWISVHADAAAADAALAAVFGDADFMKKLGDAKGLFVEGSGTQSIAARIA